MVSTLSMDHFANGMKSVHATKTNNNSTPMRIKNNRNSTNVDRQRRHDRQQRKRKLEQENNQFGMESLKLANISNNEVGIVDQYVVKFSDEIERSPTEIIEQLKEQYRISTTNEEQQNATVVWEYNHIFLGVTITDVSDEFLSFLTESELIEWIEQDVQYYLDSVPKDRERRASETGNNHYLPWSWGLDRIDSKELIYDNSYHYDYTGVGITVAVVDSGILSSHQEFQTEYGKENRVVCAYDAFDGHNNYNESVYDDTCGKDFIGHGTHLAGIVGGMISGVAKDVKLLSVKIVRNYDTFLCVGSVLAGMEYVLNEKKVRPNEPLIALMGFSGPRRHSINFAINILAREYNIFVVTSAGNEGIDSCAKSPASAYSSIVVGSSNYDDSISTYSNYGYCLDLYAPGQSIPSSFVRTDTDIVTLSGTSMSAAYVAGGIALLLEAFPDSNNEELLDNLLENSFIDVLSGVDDASPNYLLRTVDNDLVY
jgi:serine protease